MRTEFLKELGLTDEQISKVQAESGKDVQREKDKAAEIQKKLDEANTQIGTLNETIKGSEGNEKALKDLTDKVAAYEKAEAERKAAEEAAAQKAALKARFDPLKGENSYLNEGTENWIFGEFEKAIADKNNAGKSDAELYAALVRDKNVFTSPQKFKTPPAGGGRKEEEDGVMKAFLERNPGIKL